ncbi:chitin-binding protein [Streptomyces sp. SID4919]|uniref:lytic polysaccharide monooxygenase auxiliary activity family 9 protein n=1 Tax=unclassified Streptomyces TaxID=2593676 RepID=UPI000823E4F2|nr:MULTISPECIES: lytic polysaccharide monooxygenase [unclassified Streptomyces]MYY08663.1 chitin-binding protein [Streptomyces sp. SID4919]SCK55774.1 chitin-binding protein [Streptomyces sp. AmelKG-E11A]
MSAVRRSLATASVVVSAATFMSLTPSPASAHGSVFGPVSRVSACFAEGPETPKSQVCKDLVADSGTQPLYDWNEVNIANADSRHQQIIPDGKLCSANRTKYRALDWARTDWPATTVAPGPYDFNVRITAAHLGTMTMYITKQGFDPTKPLKWSDLDATPVGTYATPRASDNGYYRFTGALPARTGRHIVYKVWQRHDSPEAFYGCSDVAFGTAAASTAKAPTEGKIDAGASRSTVSHAGHGGDELPPAPVSARSQPSGSPLAGAVTWAGGAAAFAVGALLFSRGRRTTN